MSQDKPDRKLDRIRSSVISRSLALGKLGLSAGTDLAGRSLARLWESPETRDDNWKDFLTRQARRFSSEVGELKGSLMKAGQMLSVYGEHFFPPEVNQFLKTLQHDSPPVAWPAMEKILKREIEADRLAELEIDHDSMASASMGQVHRAREKSTGRSLAMKIQYPDVDKAIDSDLKAIQSFLAMIRVLPADFDTRPIFDEIREMLEQETDYVREAQSTKLYRELIGDDERFVVPEVVDRFSNRRILTTSFEQGVRPDDPLIQSLSQERRNRLAESFLHVYFKELFHWRVVQTDPHAGNYRIRLSPDGRDRFVLLDFGACREYSAEFMNSYRGMIRASILDDRPAFRRAAKELQFLREGDAPELEALFEEFCFMLVEPFKSDMYDWKNTDLPQRTTAMVLKILRGHKWRTPPREILFLDRKTGGVFIMMGILGAKLRSRDLILSYL